MEDLNKLYAQKGELLTDMEIMQGQLQKINQLIVQIKTDIMNKQGVSNAKDNNTCKD